MALWMEEGSCPTTEQERADLDAIAALKESAAIELKVATEYHPVLSLPYSSGESTQMGIWRGNKDRADNRLHLLSIQGTRQPVCEDGQEALR